MAALSVLIDATRSTGPAGASGIGSYLRALLAGLAAEPGVEVTALLRPGALAPVTARTVPARLPARWARRELDWRLPRIIDRSAPAVFHQPVPHPPSRSSAPYVQTLLDVIPLAYPDPALAADRGWFESVAPRFRRADGVIAISRHAADDGMRLLGLDPARITVVHLGVGHPFAPTEDPAPAGAPYLLLVGEPSARKGFDDALAVIAAVADAGLPHRLLMAGPVPASRRGALDRLVAAAPAEARSRVDVQGDVPLERLVRLYQEADALLFPSHYEGFGLPALEAMACGTPVLAYASTALPEVVGEAAVLAPAGDRAALASETVSLLRDDRRRAELREAGLLQAARFPWTATIAGHLEVYRATAR